MTTEQTTAAATATTTATPDHHPRVAAALTDLRDAKAAEHGAATAHAHIVEALEGVEAERATVAERIEREADDLAKRRAQIREDRVAGRLEGRGPDAAPLPTGAHVEALRAEADALQGDAHALAERVATARQALDSAKADTAAARRALDGAQLAAVRERIDAILSGELLNLMAAAAFLDRDNYGQWTGGAHRPGGATEVAVRGGGHQVLASLHIDVGADFAARGQAARERVAALAAAVEADA